MIEPEICIVLPHLSQSICLSERIIEPILETKGESAIGADQRFLLEVLRIPRRMDKFADKLPSLCREFSRKVFTTTPARYPGTPVIFQLSYVSSEGTAPDKRTIVSCSREFLFDQEDKDRRELLAQGEQWELNWLHDTKADQSLSLAIIKIIFFGRERKSYPVYKEYSAFYRLFEVWGKLPYQKILFGLGTPGQSNSSISARLGNLKSEGILEREELPSGVVWSVCDRNALVEAIKRTGLSPLNESQISAIKDRAKQIALTKTP